MGTITLSDNQQRRAEILSRLREGGLSIEQASRLLGVSERHARRLLGRYIRDGLPSVVHGNTGRSPANKTSAAMRQKLVELAGKEGTYHDFNTSHLQELLSEREGIEIGRSTLDRVLCEEGVRKRRRSRPRRVFGRRERCARAGEMLLTDGSLHAWLEERGPKMSLMGSIDDATAAVVHLRFWPSECQAGYILMAREVTCALGVPMSFYHDRHTILCSPKAPTIEDELAGREPMSQWQAILSQLGAEPIKAMTPQAKGRVERLWRTLQDRLIKEMRLAEISTLEEANAFLPDFLLRYNVRFSVEAKDKESAWVRPGADTSLDLPYYFAAKEERTVRTDHTLAWRGATLQIARKRGERSLAGTRVMVHTTPESEIFVYAGKERLVVKTLAGKRLADKAAGKPLSKPASAPNAGPATRGKPTDSAACRAWLYAKA